MLVYWEKTLRMKTINDEATPRTLWENCVYYASIFWKYRFIVIAITAVITLGTVAYCIVSVVLPPERSPLPNTYTATATILVQGNSQSDIAGSILMALGIDQRSDASPAAVRDNGDMIIEVLHSRLLLDRLIEEFGLSEKYHIKTKYKSVARKVVLAKSQIIYDRSAGSIKISYVDIDPVFAQSVANRMVSLLDEWFSMNRGLAKQKQRQTLEEKDQRGKGHDREPSKPHKANPDAIRSPRCPGPKPVAGDGDRRP
jgi:uncharacterized protein involved in exopolysaccharide biosynthesis